jgi:hypothetical protein
VYCVLGADASGIAAPTRALLLNLAAAFSSPPATATYFITSTTERAQFDAAFQDSGAKVLDSIGKSVYRSCGALDAFASHLVSHVRDTNQTWPFVLYPDFALR